MIRAAGRCLGSSFDLRPVGLTGRRVDTLLVLSCYSGPAVELFTQDVGVSGVPGCVAEDVDHDVEQFHIWAWPPRHVTGSVDGKLLDRRVRMVPCAPVEADDLFAGLA